MSISCEINLFEHSNSEYKPGDKVHGMVKYILSEDTLFSGIIISLKGFGQLRINKGKESDFYEEVYADIDDVIVDNKQENVSMTAGSHELSFEFVIPENVPPTFKYYKNTVSFNVKYEVFYYIRIKFERPGFLKFDKRFKTDLRVISPVRAIVPTAPVTHKLEKVPFQITQKKENVINLKFTLQEPVTTPGGQMKINYEVENATELNVKGIKIVLNQETTFKRSCHLDITDNETLATFSASGLKAGETQSKDFTIDIPSCVTPLQCTKNVFITHFLNAVVELPFPHWDAVLKMPIQVIDRLEENVEAPPSYDAPPSYFEVMAEYKRDDV